MLRMMNAWIVAAVLTLLSGPLIARQPPAQPTQVSPANPSIPPPSADPDRRTALVLLDRIDTLVSDALQVASDKSDKSDRSDKKSKDRAVATSGSLEGKAGRVMVDRATLDEILAHVAQVKIMLQR